MLFISTVIPGLHLQITGICKKHFFNGKEKKKQLPINTSEEAEETTVPLVLFGTLTRYMTS